MQFESLRCWEENGELWVEDEIWVDGKINVWIWGLIMSLGMNLRMNFWFVDEFMSLGKMKLFQFSNPENWRRGRGSRRSLWWKECEISTWRKYMKLLFLFTRTSRDPLLTHAFPSLFFFNFFFNLFNLEIRKWLSGFFIFFI